MADNFQDNVTFNSSTLGVAGDAVAVGTAAGAKSIIFNNSDSAGHLVWQPNANVTLSIPAGGGTIQTVGGVPGAIAAGTQTATSGTLLFSNSNNITFGMSDSTRITASYNFNFSAGTTSNNLNAITFSNSNNVSFGLNGSTITATVSQSVGLYALGNTTQNSSTTLDARTISYNGLGAMTVGYSNGSVQLSAPGTSSLSATGMASISANGSTVSIGAAMNVSAGTTSGNLTAITFSNSNGVSFGLNGSVITASAVGGGGGSLNLSAGTTSNNLTNFVLSNSNNVSFGLNGSTITASASVTQSAGLYAVGNTTQNSSTTLDVRTISYNGLGAMTVGYSNGSVQLSAPPASQLNGVGFVSLSTNGSSISIQGSMNVSAGTTSNYVTALTFSNSGIIFGLNGSVITAANTPLHTYDPYPVFSATAVQGVGTNTSGTAYFYPFVINEPVNAGFLNLAQSMAFLTVSTSSGRQSMTVQYGLYSRGTGTNNSTLSVFTSVSYGLFVTGNNSSYTIDQPTSTNSAGYTNTTTASAGSNITSGYTGQKLIVVPISSTLSPGVYWLGIFQRASTSSVNVGISNSYIGLPIGSTMANFAPIGSFSSAFSTGTNATRSIGGNWHMAMGSFTSAAQTNLPNTVALSQLTGNLSIMPYMRFYNTQ